MQNNRYPALIALILGLAVSPGVAQAEDWEHDLQWRAKLYGSAAALPGSDLQRNFGSGTPAYDMSADARFMWRAQRGRFGFELHQETTLRSGDSFAAGVALPGSQLDSSGSNGTNLLFDLETTIESGDRHSSSAGFDRFAVQWQPNEDWRVVFGREAVSWGTGRVFQPFDLFSPFAPTLVDRDYKNGSDLLLIERGLETGGDLQLLTVLRGKALSGTRSSAALKWHGVGNVAEWEVFGGRHFDENVAGVSVRLPVGGAVLRSDVTLADSVTEGTVLSAVVNIDYAFTLGTKPLYAFAEYFHNGFGVHRLPTNLLRLPQALSARLARGELFTLMRDYAALGVTYEWHPLLSHSTTLIGNLRDDSALLQSQLTTTLSDRQQLDLGVLLSIGKRGGEYSQIPLGPFPGEPQRQLTTGGSQQLYLRWVYHL